MKRKPIAWIVSYTDNKGQRHTPIHLSTRDANGGSWNVEVVLEELVK